MIVACAVLCISIDLLMWCFFRLLLYRFLSVHICSAFFCLCFFLCTHPAHSSLSISVWPVVRPPLNRCLLLSLHSSVRHCSSMFGYFRVSGHFGLATPAILATEIISVAVSVGSASSSPSVVFWSIPTGCLGSIVVRLRWPLEGTLRPLSGHSGHFRPSPSPFFSVSLCSAGCPDHQPPTVRYVGSVAVRLLRALSDR